MIAIIAVLAGMLLPALGGAREKARRGVCLGHLRQVGSALVQYSDDFHGFIPSAFPDVMLSLRDYKGYSSITIRHLPGGNEKLAGLGRLTNGYVGDTLELFGCPSHTPYTPQYVRANWNGRSGAFCAYSYRETSVGMKPKLELNPPGTGVVVDENDVDLQYYGHAWQWANVLFADTHVSGYPNAPIANDRYFTRDHTGPGADRVWQNADQAR